MHKPAAVHWFGGARWVNARGWLTVMLRGWPACCFDQQAERLRQQRAGTTDKDAVTCLKCLRVLALATLPPKPKPPGAPK